MDKLDKYRKKIDDIDASILKMIAKRMRVVEKVGKYKKRYDIQPLQTGRWEKVVARIKKLAAKSEILDPEKVTDVWDKLHEMALDIENRVK